MDFEGDLVLSIQDDSDIEKIDSVRFEGTQETAGQCQTTIIFPPYGVGYNVVLSMHDNRWLIDKLEKRE